MSNKFNARKCEYKGEIFDSKKELERYLYLNELKQLNEIEDLRRQVEYVLIDKNEYFREVIYKADFQYYHKGEMVVEDVKGLRKGAAYQLFKIKQKLMYLNYEIMVKEV